MSVLSRNFFNHFSMLVMLFVTNIYLYNYMCGLFIITCTIIRFFTNSSIFRKIIVEGNNCCMNKLVLYLHRLYYIRIYAILEKLFPRLRFLELHVHSMVPRCTHIKLNNRKSITGSVYGSIWTRDKTQLSLIQRSVGLWASVDIPMYLFAIIRLYTRDTIGVKCLLEFPS